MPIHLSRKSCFCTAAATIGTYRVPSIHKCAIVSISAARSPWTESLLDARQRFDQYVIQQTRLSTATSTVPAKVRRAGIPQSVLKRWLTANVVRYDVTRCVWYMVRGSMFYGGCMFLSSTLPTALSGLLSCSGLRVNNKAKNQSLGLMW